jgi:hypothetical protein
MNKFKFQLSKFDIGMIIAFVVVGLLGGGAWYYLSGQLQAAQAACAQVSGDYNSYATVKGAGGGQPIIVSPPNAKALADNSTLLQTQIDPLIGTYLLAKDNNLSSVHTEDPVAWKHDLDADIKQLTEEAKSQGITLPPHFFFGFSRYLTESPSDASTAVLTKQRDAIKAITEILIKAQIKSLANVQRSYEEDPHSGTGAPSPNDHTEGDQVGGYAAVVPDTYTAYPFEFDFDASPEALRPILDGLIQSPYLFVVRRIEVHNDQLDSPRLDSLAQMAGGTGAAPSVVSSSPGDTAASLPTVGPQKLFGYTPLHVKIRVDLIEWNPDLKSVADLAPKKKP